MPPGDPPRDPVLKNSQGLLHAGGQDPHLLPENQHRLDYGLEEEPGYPRFLPLSSQDPCQPRPTLPSLLQVAHHCCSVVVPL